MAKRNTNKTDVENAADELVSETFPQTQSTFERVFCETYGLEACSEEQKQALEDAEKRFIVDPVVASAARLLGMSQPEK